MKKEKEPFEVAEEEKNLTMCKYCKSGFYSEDLPKNCPECGRPFKVVEAEKKEANCCYYNPDCPICPKKLTPTKEVVDNDWEKEFDKKFDLDIINGKGVLPSLQNYVKQFISELLDSHSQKLVSELINELESNPNEDGSTSPNLQHWIEKKQSQLRKLYKINE